MTAAVAPAAAPAAQRARGARLPLRAGQAARPVAGPRADPARLLDRRRRSSSPRSAGRARCRLTRSSAAWMHATGWAGSLVVLAFACSWALPAAHLAGRRRRVRRRGPAGHLAPPARGGALAAPDLRRQGARQPHRHPGMSWPGWPSPASSAAWPRSATGRWSASTATCYRRGRRRRRRVLLAWLCVLAPTLAFAAVGLLGVGGARALPDGPAAARLLAPACCSWRPAAAAAGGRPARRCRATPSSPGAACSPARRSSAPLLVGVVVSLAWAVVATALAYLLFVRRDFTDLAYDGSGRRGRSSSGSLPLVGAGRRRPSRWSPSRPPATGSGIDRAKLRAVARRRRSPTSTGCRPGSSTARTSPRRSCGPRASCDKGGSAWSTTRARATTGAAPCPGTSPAPRPPARPSTSSTSPPNGRYVADGDGPKEVNGYFLVRTPTGDAPNPLWQFDGLVDLLAPQHLERITMQVTRQRRRQPQGNSRSRAPRTTAGSAIAAAGTAALAVAGGGIAYAHDRRLRPQPGRHRVRQRDPGLRRPDHQAAR